MWHVDEGTLHAFLDDRERGPAAGALDADTRARVAAHLDACDVCAAELRRAERDRARAATILLDASPAIEAPPFDAVQPALAPRRAVPITRPARIRGGWVPLAWAASLVLAVGAGWMGSLLWRGEAAPRSQQEAAPLATSPVQTAASPGPEPVPGAQSAAASPAIGGVRQDESRLADAATRSGETGGEAGSAKRKSEDEPRVAAAEAAPPERRELAAADVAAEQKAAGVAGVALAEQKALAVPGIAPPQAARLQTGEAALRARVAPANAAASAPAELLPAPRPTLGLAADATGAGYPGDADVAWESVSREAAEQLLGGPLYALADATGLEIAVAPQGQPVMVRVRQRAAAGQVELLQWRQPPAQVKAEALREAAPAAPAAPPASPLGIGRARDGSRFVAVPGTAHPVLLRAPADVDLAALLARVRPAR